MRIRGSVPPRRQLAHRPQRFRRARPGPAGGPTTEGVGPGHGRNPPRETSLLPGPGHGPVRTGARRWHTGFVDAAGIGGLLAQVEGRTSAATFAWLKAQPASWRSGITHVTIDLSASYAKAAREALPDAVLVADSGSGRSWVQIRHTHPGATSVPYTCPNLRKLTASRGLTRCPPLARSSCRTQRIRHIKLVPKLTVRGSIHLTS